MVTHKEDGTVEDGSGVEFERLLAVLRKLNREGGCTVGKLAVGLGVGEKLIEDCLESLSSSLNFPVLKSAGPDPGNVTYSLDKHKMNSRLPIEQQLAIAIAVNSPANWGAAPADILLKVAKSSQFKEGTVQRRGIKFDRLLAILNLFDAGGAYTASSLATRLRVDPKTILRDMDDLSFAHFPVTEFQEKGHPTKYGFAKGYQLKKGRLDVEEQLALAIAKGMSAALGPAFGTVFERFEKKVLDAVRPPDASLPIDAFIFNSFRDDSNEALQKNLMILAHACVKERVLKIKYRKLEDGTRTRRKVEPDYLFCSSEGFWYLRAFCHKRRAMRVFSVDQIHDIEVLNELREPRSKLQKLERELDLDRGFGPFQGGKEWTVVVRFSPRIRPYLERRKWHRSEEKEVVPDEVFGEGSLELRLKTTGLEGVKHWLKHWIPDMRVLEPASLRNELAREFRLQLKHFGDAG